MDRILKVLIFACVATLIVLIVREVAFRQTLKVDLSSDKAWLDGTEIPRHQATEMLDSRELNRLRIVVVEDGNELFSVSGREFGRHMGKWENIFQRREENGTYEGLYSDDPQVELDLRLFEGLEKLDEVQRNPSTVE